MRKTWMCWAAAVCAAGVLSADSVTLKDGSVIQGSLTEIHGGKVKVSTSFAGELTLERSVIERISTDAPMMVSLPDGKVEGKVSVQGGQATVGGKTVPASSVGSVWKVGASDPTLPPPPKAPAARTWKYEANFDLTGKTGNSEKTNFGGGLKATMQGDLDKLLLYARGRYGRENGVRNEQEIIGGADYESQVAGTNNSWYARLEVEHDRMNNLDRYWTGAAGYGYYLLKTDDALVRLRAGLSYQYKEYRDDMEDDDSVGMDFNYHHEFKIHSFLGLKDIGKLVTDLTYTPTFEAWSDDYVVKHESSIDLPLGGSKNWTIRLGVANEYTNRVARGIDRLETSYFARLVLSFD